MNVEEKKMRDAILFGSQIMVDCGLPEYRVKLNNRRRSLADCNSRLKIIRYSKHFVLSSTKEDFEGVTLHEIAHALVGTHHGHDAVFRAKCRELGAEERFIGPTAGGVKGVYKYALRCPECGNESRSNVKKDYICSSCKMDGKIVKFLFTTTITPIVSW